MNEALFLDRIHARVGTVWVTICLVSACVLSFMAEALLSNAIWQFPSDALVVLGGNFAPAVQSGQAWRLLSAMFLHGGVLHLLLNMVALWQAGQIVERLFGRLPYALIYLLAGLAGGLSSLWWHPGPVSVGASGAIFGIYGALLAYLLILRGEMPLGILREIRSGTLAFIGYSLFAGFMIPGVDNAAHVGGLLAGLVLGAGMCTPLVLPVRSLWRLPRAYAAMGVAVLAGLALWQTAPRVAEAYRERAAFEQAIQVFAGQEYRMEQQVQRILQAVQERKVPAAVAARNLAGLARDWNAAINGLAAQQVAAGDEARMRVLLQYGALRKQSILTLARALESGDQRWMTEAANLRLQGDNLLLQWRMREALERARGPRRGE